MKKTIISIVCSLFAFSAIAQSICGLELGSYYSKDQVHVALSRALESTDDNGMFVFTCGQSKFYFDFTGGFESTDGRFADAEVYDPNQIVKFPFGEFKVGDPLTRLLYLRANIQLLDAGESTAILSYVKGVRRLAASVKFDGEMELTEIRNFVSEKIKKAEKAEVRNPFYAAVPSVRVGTVVIKAGDPLSKLLSLNANIDFNGRPNGVCRVVTGGWKPASYLVRYNLDHVIKEILPL